MSEKFQENVTVLKQQCIGKDIYDMTIQTKHIAGHAKAGQFVSLYSNDASKLLPRPISLCGIDAEAGTLRLVYRVTGEGTGTEEFSRLKAGDTIRVLGPLGNGFTVEPGKKAFLTRFANLTPIVYASQHSIYPRLWVSLSPYKDNLMGEKCPRIWGKNYQVGRK